VAFNVDPLFHQTSALFDEGGAQGLLLNNLSVYAGCEVVFDSFEVPELKMKAQAAMVNEDSNIVDLSSMTGKSEHRSFVFSYFEILENSGLIRSFYSQTI
jgi:condensin complex subunit 2